MILATRYIYARERPDSLDTEDVIAHMETQKFIPITYAKNAEQEWESRQITITLYKDIIL